MKYEKRLILLWNDWTLEHIKKHNVNLTEIREAFKNRKFINKTYKDRQLIIGKTKKGRILTIILSYELQKEAYIVSARDSNKKEREEFRGTKTNKTI